MVTEEEETCIHMEAVGMVTEEEETCTHKDEGYVISTNTQEIGWSIKPKMKKRSKG
nr:hypothetical protein [Tanacetum cinerariifolium]